MDEQLLQQAFEIIGIRVNNNEALCGEDTFSTEDCKLLYSLGFSLYQSKDYSQAALIFQKLVQNKPLVEKHWSALGATLQMDGEYERALKCWAMAALLDPEQAEPHYYAAQCYLSLGNQEEAKFALDIAKSAAKQKDIQAKITTLQDQLGAHL